MNKYSDKQINELLEKILIKAESEGELEHFAKEHASSFTDLTDLQGLIIRGHILIEKSLTNSILMVAYNKEEFNPDKFTFTQKVIIARMYNISGLFKAEINAKLRNQIAHSLMFEEKYFDTIINRIRAKDKEYKYPKAEKVANLKRAISSILRFHLY